MNMNLSLTKVILLLIIIFIFMILFYENISINNNNDTSIDNNVCSSNCPLNKVAVLIASSSFDYPLLSYTLRSLNLFMPCRHSVHIIVDNEASMKKLVAWIDINDVTIHEWKIPESIKIKMPGGSYIIQQYVDGDSVLAAPVTCASLFDEYGRIYQMSWDIELQSLFKHPCLGLIGNTCTKSYMTTFPFLFPVRALVSMRNYIAKHKDAEDFDAALLGWANTLLGKNHDIPLGHSLSQFNVMGNYLLTFHPHLMHQVFCPIFHYNSTIQTLKSAKLQLEIDLNKDNDSKSCKEYIPAAVHYGWRTAGYLNTDQVISENRGFYTGKNKTTWDAMYYRNYEKQTGIGKYSNKYSSKTIKLIEELLLHGTCLQYIINIDYYRKYNDNTNRNRKLICNDYLYSSNFTISLHEEHNLYGGVRQPSINTIKKLYERDKPNRPCKIKSH